MAPYIGSATSRVDGFAKVTGAAKYAAEFNVSGLVHASLVCSTIAKGHITHIDASAAQRVKGVLTVLTHENRPAMADNDEAYKDEVAPDGSPYRPLYDGKIMFSRLRWSSPRHRRSRALRRHWCVWNTRKSRMSRTCIACAMRRRP